MRENKLRLADSTREYFAEQNVNYEQDQKEMMSHPDIMHQLALYCQKHHHPQCTDQTLYKKVIPLNVNGAFYLMPEAHLRDVKRRYGVDILSCTDVSQLDEQLFKGRIQIMSIDDLPGMQFVFAERRDPCVDGEETFHAPSLSKQHRVVNFSDVTDKKRLENRLYGTTPPHPLEYTGGDNMSEHESQ